MEYSLFDWFVDTVLFRGGKRGPLQASVQVQGDRVELTVRNLGKRNLKFAAVEGRDDHRKRVYPTVDLDVRFVFPPGQAVTASLSATELKKLNCRSLAILDTSGNAWPVEANSEDLLG